MAVTAAAGTPSFAAAVATFSGAPPGYGVHDFTSSLGTPIWSARQSNSASPMHTTFGVSLHEAPSLSRNIDLPTKMLRAPKRYRYPSFTRHNAESLIARETRANGCICFAHSGRTRLQRDDKLYR